MVFSIGPTTLMNAKDLLTLAGTRHFAILHGTRGSDATPLAFGSCVSWSCDEKTACYLSRVEAVDTRF